MYLMRRLLVGAVIGAIAAGLSVSIASAGEAAPFAQGPASILIAGILLGLSYAGLFRPVPGGQTENLMSGLVLGIITWIILELTVYPVLQGNSPEWETTNAAVVFSQLIVYLLLGGLISLVYGLLYGPLKLSGAKVVEADAPPRKHIVILGGGYAGVSAAAALDGAFRDEDGVGIWLVSQTNYLVHTPMLSEVSASAVSAQNISPPLRSFFRRVQVVQGVVEGVDLDRRVVQLVPDSRSRQRTLPFDHLVLTMGGVPSFFGDEGIESNAFTFKTLSDGIRLRNQIIDMFERADFEKDPDGRRRLLTFVVAGGGFAGVELIGGMNDFARGMLPYYPNVLPEEVRLILVHSRDIILPELSSSLSRYAQEKLEQRGVEFRLGVRVTGATPGLVHLGDEAIATETFVWTAGNQPSPVLKTMGLPLTQRGQIEVTAELAVPGVPGLWAAGDCAQIPDLVTGKTCPPTAQHATRQGKLLGHNIAASIAGKPVKQFKFKTLGSLAALGHQLAVAEIFGYRFSGFLAWLMWRAIYLSKLPTMDKQVRVFLDWLLDIFFPPDIVQTVDFSRAPHDPTKDGAGRAR